MKHLVFIFIVMLCQITSRAQQTFPVNGVADHREGCYAFRHASISSDGINYIADASMVIRDGKIVSVGSNINIPADAVEIDCKGKFIYPSFIDIYSNYGMPGSEKGSTPDIHQPGQFSANQKGAFGWNPAIRSEIDAARIFITDDAKAKPLRESGFGLVLSHLQDGIARGTGTVVSLAGKKENLVIIKERATSHYSFNKGSSAQSYPSSLMGTIALLRQYYMDAAWYKTNPAAEGVNITLKAFNEQQDLPQIFDAGDKWNDLRAWRLGNEFGAHYIIKGGGNEYQRIADIAATHAAFIIPVNFPLPIDVEDPNDARFVSLTDMKHWELAPTNPAAIEKAGIKFCLTSADLKETKLFPDNIRKAIDYGLSPAAAIEALTKTPATLLGIYDKTGSLEPGKLANFLITSDTLFTEKSKIIQNWIQGEKYGIKEDLMTTISGPYDLVINTIQGDRKYSINIKSNTYASMTTSGVNISKYNFDGKVVRLDITATGYGKPIVIDSTSKGVNIIKYSFDGNTVLTDLSATGNGKPKAIDSTSKGSDTSKAKKPTKIYMTNSFPVFGLNVIRLTGMANGNILQGTGVDSIGNPVSWSATPIPQEEKIDSTSFWDNDIPKDWIKYKDQIKNIIAGKVKDLPKIGNITYPFCGYGWEVAPAQQDILIRNATVWTNEPEGKLLQTDVLIRKGKIAAIGKNLDTAKVRVIDGTGKHLTAGIIDEHSHIAAMSINEGAHSVTSEVRIGDNLNPEDINIYRQLSGGVTTSHILHGSANTIGGQTQLIKLRWGMNDEQLKFQGADPFIKFALGENVKHTGAQGNTRFPDTRMGVNEVMVDAFTRAVDYEKALHGPQARFVRHDLELDALVEIMHQQRFITCHSYVQSEIIAAMRLAEQFGFRINTFTHILEGYKVADKMKAHGANASSFSDWWAYKTEVQDAIPYNAALMNQAGINVAINSDDAEMARRLNQEAAKSVKYGGMSEEDALKMVTLNPARMLHVDGKVGSIKVGKDADLVLWSDNPLSIYATSLYTMVDGIIYFNRESDLTARKQIATERNRLIQRMIGEKKKGVPMTTFTPAPEITNECGDHGSGILMNETD